MTADARFRDRMVLGPVLRYLDGDETLVAWTHVNVPATRSPAVLLVTNRNCLLYVASSAIPDVSTPIEQLSAFSFRHRNAEVVRLRLSGANGPIDVELSLTNRVRSRSVGRVLSALTERHVAAPDSFNPALTSPIPPMVRSVRHHARRVWITILGVTVLLLSVALSLPGVPGPGALIAVAGVAILAREYEWARDVHVGVARQVDRLLSSVRRRPRPPR
ncbi:MAG: PGPGW domain-containing protein [Nitriliruptoraceae bacterium]